MLHQPGAARSDEFLTVLAEALILSGMAMAVAGSSRPASGGDHEIMHAINDLFPGTASHGELAGLGALFCGYAARGRRASRGAKVLPGAARTADAPAACRAGPPDQLVKAVLHAPATRPGRYTILERLAMSPAQVARRVEDYVRAIAG